MSVLDVNAQTINAKTMKVVVLASLGSALEFYELIIYGVFAQYISVAFFPNSDPIVSLIATFGVFAVGYASRPLGGVLLAHYGDRVGRRGAFIVSVLIMSFATIGIGLVPDYAAIGILAPLLLVFLRLVQGASIGGELACAITYVVEMTPNRRGLVSGILISLVITGVFIANGVSAGLHKWLTPDQMQSFGWRLAFLLGGIIGLGSYWIRKTLAESPEFERVKTEVERIPLTTTIRTYWREVLVGTGTTAVLATFNGLFYVHMTPYLTRVLKYDPLAVSEASLLGILCYLIATTGFGWLSDYVSRKIIFIFGALLLLVGSVPFYNALTSHSMSVFSALAVAGLAAGPVCGTFSAIMADLFPTKIRFTGVALAYGISSAVFNGLTPLLAVYLIERTGLQSAPGLLLAGVSALGVVAGLTIGNWTKPSDWWYGPGLTKNVRAV